jgi:hypothetical protein
VNSDRIVEILGGCGATLCRNGRACKREHTNLNTSEMPLALEMDPGLEQVDCHFVTVAVDKARVVQHEAELRSLVAEWPNGVYREIGWVEASFWLKLPESAFLLFGVGQVLGWWRVITPASVQLTGDRADSAAAGGMILCKPIS